MTEQTLLDTVDFNPHSHKGSDLCYLSDKGVDYDFNPHSHKGSDMIDLNVPHLPSISIHTPTRGVTNVVFSDYLSADISIHTPTRGVTAKMHIKASRLLFHFYIFYTNIYCISIASQTKN